MGKAMSNVQAAAPAAEVRVTCAARLHLGFLDLNGGLGRCFGSIGLALEEPLTRLVLRRANGATATGPEHDRAAQFLAIMTDHLRIANAHALRIDSAIPSHSGLGSGTQLALAVATAARRLHGLADAPRDDAWRLRRGGRSGIGIGLFEHGGLVVDGGHGALAGPPPLLLRMRVPESWRVLLLFDRSLRGLSGGREADAFAALAPMPAGASAEICRLLMMRALPGLAEDDVVAFGNAITRIQEIVGDYFTPAQGGRFASPAVAAALGQLRAAGAAGVGQSSWGPTGFAFARDDGEAARLAEALIETTGIAISVCRARNRGAEITIG